MEEVPLGLVQPARAVLRDYYNPGETLGILERVGVSGSEEWQEYWLGSNSHLRFNFSSIAI